MRASITGGTGFLGSALVRMLVEQKADVRVLVRRPEDDAPMRALGATPVRGDLTTLTRDAGLVRPGDVLFHLAARVDVSGTWAQFRRATVDGTRRLLAHALVQKPERVVYASSAGVYRMDRPPGPSPIDHVNPVPHRFNVYGRAKLAAESEVRTACDRAGVPCVILRLGFLYGPGNRALLNHILPLLAKRRLLVIGNGDNRIATLYVEDAASALILAGTRTEACGKIYDVASDEHVTQRRFVTAAAEAVGWSEPLGRVSLGLARTAGRAADLLAHLRWCTPKVSRTMVALMTADQVIDASPIREELGWRPKTPFEEGARLTRRWFESLKHDPLGLDARCTTDAPPRSEE